MSRQGPTEAAFRSCMNDLWFCLSAFSTRKGALFFLPSRALHTQGRAGQDIML